MESSLLDSCVGLVSVLLLLTKCRILLWQMPDHCDFRLILRTVSYELGALCIGSLVGALYVAPSSDNRYTLLLLSLPTVTLSSSNGASDHISSCLSFTLSSFVADIFSSIPFYLTDISDGQQIAWAFVYLVCVNYCSVLLVVTFLKGVMLKSAELHPTKRASKQSVESDCTDHLMKQWFLSSILIPTLSLSFWKKREMENADSTALVLFVSLFRLTAQLVELPGVLVRRHVCLLEEMTELNEQSLEEVANSSKNPPVRKAEERYSRLAETAVLRKFNSKSDFCNTANRKQISKSLSNEEVLQLLNEGKLQSYALEKLLEDDLRAVLIRRQWFAGVSSKNSSVSGIPFSLYDYSSVTNACCENVLGFVPIPVGFAGPIKVDDQIVYIPMCTTEGCLVASVNRGCLALMKGSGVHTALLSDCMTRGPVLAFENVHLAARFKSWLEDGRNFPCLAKAFENTSRFAKLKTVQVGLVGRFAFVRFGASTGDAMGMNMVSKGVEAVLEMLQRDQFPMLTVISLSGNYCVDKKSSAINWILGRGRSVTGEAVLPASVVRETLKTDVDKLIQLNTVKNFVGSAKAGVIGGFNAHCANVVAAVFAATGQDLAQVVGSSQCLTFAEKTDEGDLRISCTMPCLEVGTIGGGTGLCAQRACLEILGCAGGCESSPGANARRLSQIICSAVIAGELSLLAALASGSLVRSHMRYNRKNVKTEKSMPGLTVDHAGEVQSIQDQLNGLVNKCLMQDMVCPPSCSSAFT